jgi:hypothetical protein
MGFAASASNLIGCVSGRRFAQQLMQFVSAATAKLGKCERMLFHPEIHSGANTKEKSPRNMRMIGYESGSERQDRSIHCHP